MEYLSQNRNFYRHAIRFLSNTIWNSDPDRVNGRRWKVFRKCLV